MTPREKIKELICLELDDAMSHTYSEQKVARVAPARAEKLTEQILEILREAMQ